jgi:hypothetical protein
MTRRVPARRKGREPCPAVTNAENRYDYAGQDPINGYDLSGLVKEGEEEEGGGIGGEPVGGTTGAVAGGAGGDGVIDTEFGFTRVSQLNRFGRQLYTSGPRSLEKSIRSFEKLIEEHEEKIRVAIRTEQGTGRINKLYNEIVNFRSQIAAARFVLRYGAIF